MKKILFLMIAALSVSFVSADTLSWTNTQGISTTTSINRSTFVAGKTFTFCLNNLSSAPKTIVTGDILKSIVMVRSDTATTVASYMKISDGDGNSYVSSAVTSASSDTAITNSAGAAYTRTLLTYAFDDSNITLDGSKTYTFQFYSNADASTTAASAFSLSNAMDDGLSNSGYSNYEVFMTINAERPTTATSATVTTGDWASFAWTNVVDDWTAASTVNATLTTASGVASVTLPDSLTLNQLILTGSDPLTIVNGTPAPIIRTVDASAATGIITVPANFTTGNFIARDAADVVLIDVTGVTLGQGATVDLLTTTSAVTCFALTGTDLVEGVDYSLQKSGSTLQVKIISDVTFTQLTDWADRTMPTKAFVLDSAPNAGTGFSTNALYDQTLGGKASTVALVLAGGGSSAGLYGVHPYGGGSGQTVTKDIYLAVTGGTYNVITAGQEANWQSNQYTNLTGNQLTEVGGGSETVTANVILGGGDKGGYSATITGNTGVVVKDNVTVSTVLGGWASAHNVTPVITGNSSVVIKSVIPARATAKDRLPVNTIIGAGASSANSASSTTVRGNSSVLIDLPTTATGTFAKTIVGGGYATVGTQLVQGSSSVTINAPDAVTFDQMIVGGGRRGAGGTVTTTGATSVTLNGGTYTNNIFAGAYGDAGANAGSTRTITIQKGVFNGASLMDGYGSGASTLAFAAGATPTFNGTTVGNMQNITFGDNSTVTLAGNATFSSSTSDYTVTSTSGKILASTDATLTTSRALNLAAGNTLTLAAAPEKTLTFAATTGGEGALALGDDTNTGTVVLGTTRPRLASIAAGTHVAVELTADESKAGTATFPTTMTVAPEASVFTVTFGTETVTLTSCTIDGNVLTLNFNPVNLQIYAATATLTANANLSEITWVAQTDATDTGATREVTTAMLVACLNADATGVTLNANVDVTVTLDTAVTIAKPFTFGGTGAISLAGDAALTLTTTAINTNVTYTPGSTLSNFGTATVAVDKVFTYAVNANGINSSSVKTIATKVMGEGAFRIYASGASSDKRNGETGFTSAINLAEIKNIILDGTDAQIRLGGSNLAISSTTGYQKIALLGNAAWQTNVANANFEFVSTKDGKANMWNSEGFGAMRLTTGTFAGTLQIDEGATALMSQSSNSTFVYNGEVYGPGTLATGGLWGTATETRTLNAALTGDHTLGALLIRNSNSTNASQGETTTTAKANTLTGAAVTFAVGANVANKSSLTLAGNNTIASLTATNGGTLNLNQNVVLTIDGDATMTGLTLGMGSSGAKIIVKGTMAAPTTLSLGDRALTAGESLIEWTNIPTADFTIANGVLPAGCEIRKLATGLYVVATPTQPADDPDTFDATVKTELEKIAIANDITKPFTVEVQKQTSSTDPSNTTIAVADVNAVMECFTNLETVASDKDTDTPKLTVKYNFGITELTPAKVVASVLNSAGEAGGIAFADGVTVTLYADEVEVTGLDVNIDGNTATFTGDIPVNKYLKVKATK